MVNLSKITPLDCEDDVPLHRVRANQLGILLSVIVTIFFEQHLILLLPLLVQLISRRWGVKYNLFVLLLLPIIPRSEKTEARVLLRFNQLLAILFLVGAIVSFTLGATVIGYVILGMLTTAVLLALMGFCVGCLIYFQWKQFRAKI